MMREKIAIEWKKRQPKGRLEIQNGKLAKMRIATGAGEISKDEFAFSSKGSSRLEVVIDDAKLNLGSDATMVTLRAKNGAFSFFLRDVRKDYPILIPDYGVAVVPADDHRSYNEIEKVVFGAGLQNYLQRIENEPEETYESASARTRKLCCPTWLGLSRDMRIFEIGFREGTDYWDYIQPRFHGHPVPIPEANDTPLRYNFVLGRGIGCVQEVTRRLEEGVLPILRGEVVDDDVQYNFTAFVTLESTRLSAKTLRGTHFLVADGYGYGNMLTAEQKELRDSLLPGEINRDEETVLFFGAEAANSARVPRYAWFKTVLASSSTVPRNWSFDGKTGFGIFESGRVYSVSRLNGRPMPQEEIAVLLAPGETASFEFLLLHRPVSKERAEKLAKQDFAKRHRECREFWKEKLKSAASVKLPERRIDEMVKAGLLHLDLVAYGLEPNGTVAPTIGVYCPIGSESAPIVQFFDSMGWHDLAKRSLMYFLEKQHKDGFIQNFGGYMLETGAALWSIGEHYRYTRDDDWLKEIAPKLLKSCEYILKWRGRNKKKELRGRGYGMIDGKVGDPEDPYHIFMLNGYACMGLSRVAEIIGNSNPVEAKRLKKEAEEFKKDIRASFFEAMEKSPVVPLGDGSWCPTSPPWAEANRGPVCLYAEKGNWFTHGTFTARDSLVGPLHLVFQEVLAPDEKAAGWLLNYQAELMHIRNVALSQPYYSPHPWIHLSRGEVKPFLKACYNGFAGLADRETYTFWEHYFHASPHKTHEEAWFLMQTRWMLYMEKGETLKIFPGAPRVWFENGKRIELQNVASYFGPLSVNVESRLKEGRIEATVECKDKRRPKRVELRLPHPEGRKATRVEGGVYDAPTESVRVEPFRGRSQMILEF